MRQQIRRGVFLRLSIAFTAFGMGVCTNALWSYERSTKIDTSIGQTTPIPTPSPTPNSPIRSVDFHNFTYPEIGMGGTFTLKDGHEPDVEERRAIVDVIYGDVTEDGLEDAMVVQSRSVRGSAIPFFVYVYSMTGTKPSLLWAFDAGERGDGGLRQISAQCGDMVIELYGRDRVINGGSSSAEDNSGLCCPPFFTRSRYEWRGRHFRLKSKEVRLPNPQGSAAYLPLLERRQK